MKRFLIVLMLLMFISPVFAKTVQCVKSYQVYKGSYANAYGSTYDVAPDINFMLSQGWLVVSITPVTVKSGDTMPTDYVIVLFEREE